MKHARPAGGQRTVEELVAEFLDAKRAAGTLERFFVLWRKWYGKGEPGQWALQEKAERFETLVYRAASNGEIPLSKAAYLLRKSLADFERSLEVVP